MSTSNLNKQGSEYEGSVLSYPKKSWARWHNTYTVMSSYTILKIHDESGNSVEFKIDTEDLLLCLESYWYYKLGGKGNKYYCQRTVTVCGRRPFKKVKTVFLHKEVFGDHSNDLDHINRDSTDNRKSNLREASKSQNMANIVLINKSSGLPVGAYPHLKRFRSFIILSGKRVNLGMFDSAEEASSAWKKAHSNFYKKFSPYYGDVL